jgi:serine/threonine-protein kinase
VYSLGIILYEMLSGKLPFSADTAAELARMHLEDQPPLISTKVPGIPPALEQILLKVLSKEPSARYRTADQLARVLLNFVNAQDTPALALTPEIAPKSFPRRTVSPTPSQPQLQPAAVDVEEQTSINIDWVSAGLGLLALLAVGGLIPFWLWVYFVYNPPIR